MTIEFNDFFGQNNFHVTTISPDVDTDQIPTFCYPGAVSESWVPGIAIQVRDISGSVWVGYFLRGTESPNGIEICCAHPDGNHIVVVSRGTPYVVSAVHPKRWEELSIQPVVGYCVGLDEGVLLLYGFTNIIGLCADGSSWRTQSLSWDGLRSVRVVDGIAEGEGWDASTSSYVPFRVDVQTGEFSGGASPPN